jgi:hypothetical protein
MRPGAAHNCTTTPMRRPANPIPPDEAPELQERDRGPHSFGLVVGVPRPTSSGRRGPTRSRRGSEPIAGEAELRETDAYRLLELRRAVLRGDHLFGCSRVRGEMYRASLRSSRVCSSWARRVGQRWSETRHPLGDKAGEGEAAYTRSGMRDASRLGGWCTSPVCGIGWTCWSQ